MTAQSVPSERPCKVCGSPVVENSFGGMVHVGGGSMMQKCKNPSCGWSGGQIGGFTSCPRCGDSTQLSNEHQAS